MPIPNPSRRPPAVSPDDAGFSDFEGIVNTKTGKEIGNKGLKAAQNCEIDDSKRIFRRNGYALFAAGAYRDGYALQDQSALYAVIGTTLVRQKEDGTTVSIKTGLNPISPPSGFSWSEDAMAYVAYTNGNDCGIIRGDVWVPLAITTPVINSAVLIGSAARVATFLNFGATYTSNKFRVFVTYTLVDGRESAPSQVVEITAAPEAAFLRVDVTPLYAATNLYACNPGGTVYYLVTTSTTQQITATVTELFTNGDVDYSYTTALEGFPAASRMLCHHGSRLFTSEFIAAKGVSVVWRSLPMQHHLYNKAEEFLTVLGEVVMMLSTPSGLVIGTDAQLYGWDGEKLTELTQYGVVPGSCGDVSPDGIAYFWTLRGIAKAFPYELLTEKHFSGDPGVFNHARLFYEHGYCKLLAATVTGNPTFNQRTER